MASDRFAAFLASLANPPELPSEAPPEVQATVKELQELFLAGLQSLRELSPELRLLAEYVHALVHTGVVRLLVGPVTRPVTVLLPEQARIVIPLAWASAVDQDAYRELGYLGFAGSIALDFYHGQTSNHVQERAEATQAAVLHAIQAHFLYLPNESDQELLRRYPQGRQTPSAPLYPLWPLPTTGAFH